ncbi:hypothetical protein [Tabrizicola sp.]|uniref:hypothetical protein n=1 Tax=Tabrizicola sp. TaxID=2005166 RepID=UPI00286C3E92|nr:hypothetical protein [Tabrizicola sp.]
MRGTLAALLAALILAPCSGAAETAMTAEEFDAFSVGKTLEYTIDGQDYGSESHLPGRRVIDADTGGPCHPGRWEPRGEDICFVYDADPTTLHCWRYWRDGEGLLARAVGSAPQDPPARVTVAAQPLVCPGPEVGV